MLHPGITIRNSKVVAPYFQHSVCLINHFCHIHEWVIRTHKSINCRFIYHQIERLVLILHLSYIHDIKLQSSVSFLFCSLFHLFNHNFGDIIADDVMVSIFVKILLNAAVATADVQNPGLFTFGHANLELSLHRD